MQTALQTERVLHLRGSLRYNVEVFSEPAKDLTPRIYLLWLPIFSLISPHTRIRNTTLAHIEPSDVGTDYWAIIQKSQSIYLGIILRQESRNVKHFSFFNFSLVIVT